MKKIFTFCFLFLIIQSRAQCGWNFTVTSLSGSYSITCNNPNPISLQTAHDNTNAVNYFWSGPTFTSGATSVILSQAGVYTVTATDPVTTCSLSQTFTIYINAVIPTNTVSPASQSVLCTSNLVSFTGTIANPTANVLFQWYSPLNPLPAGVPVVSSNNTLSVFSGSFSPGEYTLVTTNTLNGCSASSTFSITSPDAFPFFNVSSTTGFSVGCTPSNQTTLSINNAVSTQSVPAIVSFTFLPPAFAGSLAPGPYSQVASTITALAGTWTVVVNDNSNACQTMLRVPILQSPVSANFSHTVNAGGLVNFISTSTGANGGTTYSWDFGDATTGTGLTTTHTYSNGGIHHVTLTTNGPNCSITHSIDVSTVPCSANANYTLIPSGTPQFWYAIPAYYGNVTDVLWAWGDLNFDNTLYPTHTYTAAGVHTICLTVTVSCGNSTTSCSSYNVYKTVEVDQNIVTVNVVNKVPVGIKNIELENDPVSLYPNPSNSVIYIKNELQRSGTIHVFNFEGKEIERLILKNSGETKIEDLNAGIYFVEIKLENSVYRKKVVVIK